VSTGSGFTTEPDGRLRPPQLFAADGMDERFWTDGFVLTSMFSGAEMSVLAEGFAQLRPSDGFDPRTLTSPRCTYHCTFLDGDRPYRRRSDQLVREFFAERLSALLPGYRILTSNVYAKPAGAGRFEIHQNWPTIDDLAIPTFTAWAPLQDTTFENGTLRIVRGGHRIFPDVAAASSDRFFDDFSQELVEEYLEPIDVRSGEVLIFDDSLLHWSGANHSSSPRISFQVELVPTDATTVLWIRDPEDVGQFQLWGMDTDYWLDYDFESVLGRPDGLPLLGRRPNPNRRLSLQEFDDMLGRADEIRRSRYVLDDRDRPTSPVQR
jgi:hypothetical protein